MSIDPGTIQVAVIATGVAEVALAVAMDYETLQEKRETLAKILVRFAKAYCHATGSADLGVDCEEYINS
jgi:hypothetical protein